MNPVPAALEASTLPLGYQGGGCLGLDFITTYLLGFNPNIYTINFKCFALLFLQLKLMFDLTIDSALNILESELCKHVHEPFWTPECKYLIMKSSPDTLILSMSRDSGL